MLIKIRMSQTMNRKIKWMKKVMKNCQMQIMNQILKCGKEIINQNRRSRKKMTRRKTTKKKKKNEETIKIKILNKKIWIKTICKVEQNKKKKINKIKEILVILLLIFIGTC